MVTSDNEIEIRCMKIIGKNNLHGQKRMMFAGAEIVILPAALSHQLLFLRKHLDCVEILKE